MRMLQLLGDHAETDGVRSSRCTVRDRFVEKSDRTSSTAPTTKMTEPIVVIHAPNLMAAGDATIGQLFK